jgi:hypothetical protein
VFLLSVSVAISDAQTTAIPANDFLNTMGVCAHVKQGVDDVTTVNNGLIYTGIRNLRDDGTTSSSVINEYLAIHKATLAKLCLLPVDGDIPDTLSMLETVNAAGALLAAEGPNEINNYSVTYDGATSSYTGSYLPAAEFQRDLYTAIKADTKLAGIPVWAPSEAGGSEPDNVGFQYLVIPNGSNLSMADGTIYGDLANCHNYLNNGVFTAPIDNHAWLAEDPQGNTYFDGLYSEYGNTWNKHYLGYSLTQLLTLPRVTTETGWKTQGTGALTEDQQGRIFLNLFLDAEKRGWNYTFIYMLRDDPNQGYWGLIHQDDTPKLSGKYIHNMTTILADNVSNTPGSLNYSVPNEPATVHDLLLQKSNGTFELAVWDERAGSSDAVTVNLGATYASINLYDPTMGTSPMVTLTNADSVPLTLSDHPVFIELPSAPNGIIQTSTGTLTVNDGSSGSFTVSLLNPPTSNVTVKVSITGTPNLTVSPSTLTMTPQNYQNQTVTVTAGAVNSNDWDRNATVLLTTVHNSASVLAYDVAGDAQAAPNLLNATPPLTGGNIGTNAAGDSSVRASGNWWVDGSGAGGVSGTADAFHFESLNASGDFQMMVNLQDVAGTGTVDPLAGLMIRDGTAAGSNFIALAGTTAPGGGYTLLSRTSVNAAATSTPISSPTYTYPAAWLKLTRAGGILHAFVSSDGVNFTEVTDPIAGVTWTGMSNTLSAGVFSSSGNVANTRAIMSNFSVTPATAVTPAPPTLSDADIGNPGVAGSASSSGGVYTVTGGGADIFSNYDQFNYDSQSVTGDNTIIAHVDSEQNTNAWSKACLMFRDSLDPAAANVAVTQEPNGAGIDFQWRDSPLDADYSTAKGFESDQGQITTSSSANWLKLVKAGNTYTAYYATTTGTPTASQWVLFGTHTTTLTNATYLAGLAVTAHDNSQSCTAVFSNVSIQKTSPGSITLADGDIGSPGQAGSASVLSGVYTVSGGGADLYGYGDQCNFDAEQVTGDNTIIAQVDSQTNTNYWAKAGIMFRDSTSAGAANICMLENPNNLVELEWRDSDNSYTGSVGQVGATGVPKWLALVKSGTTYTGYYATTTSTPKPSDWVLVGSHTTTVFSGLNYLAGLVVTAHDNTMLGTAVFSNLSIQATPQVVSIPEASAAAIDGLAFNYQVNASNNASTYSATGLPSGLSINSSSGLISGTPSAVSGATPVSITISNNGGTVVDSLLLTVEPPIPAVSGGTTSGLVNTPLMYQVQATNNPTTYNALNLPYGLTCDPNTGLISGTPTLPGTSLATLFASNASGTGVSYLAVTVTSPSSPAIAPTDTPTMPQWGLAILGLLLLVTAGRFLPKRPAGR